MKGLEELPEDKFEVFVPPILECRLLIKELEKERESNSRKPKVNKEQRKGYSLRIF
jgi:hypothetical protein